MTDARLGPNDFVVTFAADRDELREFCVRNNLDAREGLLQGLLGEFYDLDLSELEDTLDLRGIAR